MIDREGYDHTIASAHASLQRLGTDYLDLYLIHWPFDEAMTETWRAMQDLRAAGLVRAIGVSNFGAARLDRLLAEAAVVPAVNQIELHPRFAQTTLRNYCRAQGIIVQSWSPLQQGSELLTHPVIAAVATAHGCSPAQIILRWHVQHGLVVIPRSSSPEHIRANTAIFDFELTTPEMAALDSLDVAQRANPIVDPDSYVFTDEVYERLQAIND